ncbi:hypothetical protein TIFTF001_046414 [Ficus carica]|uniref:ABC-type xenobiotic transporter n=1 Tax=Ficus carica TaxID=3494 RepID=A0AA87ZEK8_FICCA|nr:hypothetical protein TIFTF001_046414 [Ficus carica]
MASMDSSLGALLIHHSISISLFVSFFSVAGFGNLIAKSDIYCYPRWLVKLFRALVWISLSPSLLLQRSKWIRVMSSVWWASNFSLIKVVNVEKLLRTRSTEIVNIVLWIVEFLLLICAFKNLAHIMVSHNSQDDNLTDPLVVQNSEKRVIELDRAGFLSKLMFSWMGPLLRLGNSKPLSLEDIPSLVSEDEANLAYQKFKQAWDSLLREKDPRNTKNSVLGAIVKVYMKENITIGILALLRTICVVVSPLILYAFVHCSNRDEENLQEGLSILGCLIVTKLVESLSQRHWFFDARRCGMRIRSALMVAVYEKQLKLSSLGRRRHSTGEIVNYVAIDAYRMGECLWWFHTTWCSGVQIFLAIAVLFKVIGSGALPGLVPILICGLLNVPFAKLLQKCQFEFMMAQDERIRATSEILNNIKIIKLQSWEEKFKNLIESHRDREFKWLAEAQLKKVYGTLLYWISPTIVSSVVFFGCILLGSAPLNASTIFTILATLRSLSEPVRMIPEALSAMIQVKVSVYGSIAYVSQTSWIQSGTVRENILFGKPMEKDKYEKAIVACALDKDINSFDHGDLTEIGQRGINLSGGQKQRIQLARAVYNDADIYLLDDPFSAVDAHTAAILFNECVMAALRDKTVILVTHQVEFLSEVDKILVMQGGKITQSGSYEELLEAGTAFEQLVNAHKDSITTLGPSNDDGPGEPRKEDIVQSEEIHGSYTIKHSSEGEISAKGLPAVQLTQEEEKEIGNVGWKPFWDYIFVSKGLFLLVLVVIMLFGFVGFQAAATYWLALASDVPNITSGMLVGIYTAISTLSAVFVYLRSFFGAHLGLRASKSFFSGFNNAIFKAPMLFFDSTPVGRILTRASSDLSIVDYDIPFSMVYTMAAGIEFVGTIAIMASVTWQVLIVSIFSMAGSKYAQVYYQAAARELIRINGTTKAPVTNHVSETSLGVVTIRAFRSVDRFFHNYLKLVDKDATLFFLSNAAIEWLVIRIEALQNLTLFTAAFFLVLLPKSQVAPGLVGLSLSYALSLTGTIVFMTRWYCNLANYIVSVERIKQFMHIPIEPPAIIEGNRPPPSWPTKGRIELLSLRIKYRPNAPTVLKGITCTFREGTRVGVVGRTGSGKTTLISALFRLVEPTSGKIVIDGLDICSIGLKDLRMKLSIIPQEPTLFRGSIRTNLDPLGLYSDDEIWRALEKCQLKATVDSLPNLLDSSVTTEKIGVPGNASSSALAESSLRETKF